MPKLGQVYDLCKAMSEKVGVSADDVSALPWSRYIMPLIFRFLSLCERVMYRVLKILSDRLSPSLMGDREVHGIC